MPDQPILLIDDEESIRQILALALQFEGYDVLTASNGQDALDLLSQINPPPFMILLDLMMPILDGWGFMTAIAQMPEHSTIPIVVITAFSSKSEATQGFEIIRKPVELQYLFEVVKKYHEKRPGSAWSPIGLAG